MKRRLHIQSMANLRREIDEKMEEKFAVKKKRCVVCGKVIRNKHARKYCSTCKAEAYKKSRAEKHRRYLKTERGKQAIKKYQSKPEVKAKAKAKQKIYYEENKEMLIAKTKEWIKNNRERNNKRSREYQAEKKRKAEELTPENVKRSCNAKQDIMKGFGYDNLAEDIKESHTILYNKLKGKDTEVNTKMGNGISQTSIKQVMKENRSESYCIHNMVRAFNLDVTKQEVRSQMSWAMNALMQKGWVKKVGKRICADNLKPHTFYQFKQRYKKKKVKSGSGRYKHTEEHNEKIRKKMKESWARKKGLEVEAKIETPKTEVKGRLVVLKEVQTITCPHCRNKVYITED